MAQGLIQKSNIMKRLLAFAFTLSSTFAQIPGSAIEDPSLNVAPNVSQATDLKVPTPSSISGNTQNINLSPTLQPGSTSITAPGGGATATDPSSAIPNPSQESEKVLAEKAKALLIDPSSEKVVDGKSGRIWDVTDSRFVEAGFGRYLTENSRNFETQEAYLARLSEILELLCPSNPYGDAGAKQPTRASLAKAYAVLRQIGAEFREYDHDIARTIANQVDSVNAAMADRARLYEEAKKIEQEITRLKWNLDVTVKGRMDRMSQHRGDPDPEQTAANATWLAQSASPYLRDLAKQQALQAAKVTQAEAKVLLAKADFQALLTQLFLQRRYQHVLIAAGFYRASFADGELSVKAEGALARLVDQTGTPLTISTLETITLEAISIVRRGMDAVKNMLAVNQIKGASDRLLEAFSVGENLPELQSFPVESRRKIHTFRQLRREAESAVSVKDFGRAEERDRALAEMATDYDPALVRAAVEAAKTKSNFHLAAAKNAASRGDRIAMEAESQAAAESGPQNPALREGAEKMMEQFNLQARSLTELDALLEKRDLRSIAEKKEMYLAAVATDEVRQKRLRDAMENLVAITKAEEKAEELDRKGFPGQAWVVVETQNRTYPNDAQFSHLSARLAAKVPTFVRQVTLAREAMAAGENMKALHAYLAALREEPTFEEAQQCSAELAKQELYTLEK